VSVKITIFAHSTTNIYRMMSQPKNLYLLDAYALIYRAYFSFGKRHLTNAKGQNVSAPTGFVNTLWGILNRSSHTPTHIAVAFDPSGPTFRSREHSFYKANREEMPEDIRASIPVIRDILAGFNIPILECPDYEADDVIGTIATKAANDGFTVYMVTSDKDYGQLVSDNIKLYKPAHLKKPVEIMGVAEILAKWGDIQETIHLIDVLALMGDSVDNIPGVKGIGQKTACKLVKQWGTVENIIANIDQLKGAMKRRMEAGIAQAKLSKYLATIVTTVPVAYKPETYTITPINKEALSKTFAELAFRSLGKRIIGPEYTVMGSAAIPKANKAAKGRIQGDLFAQAGATVNNSTEAITKGNDISNTPHQYHFCDTPEKQEALLTQLLQQQLVAFDTETSSLDVHTAKLVGMSFSFTPHEGYYVPLCRNKTVDKSVLKRFMPFFEAAHIAKVGQNIKYDLLVLRWHGITLAGTLHDTMLAHYLLHPAMRHNMTFLSETYLQYSPIPIEKLIGKKGKNQKSMLAIPPAQVSDYAAEDADITLQLHQYFAPKIEAATLHHLYNNIEVPLVRVLADIEYNGINLDAAFLNAYANELKTEIVAIKKSIFDMAGVEFNVDSTLQLGKVLFDRLKIPYKGKRTKTGRYSTNEETLNKLAGEHVIAKKIVEYRGLTKLLSTYVDALPKQVNHTTQRIHSTFNQMVAATGRLSSLNPNLQNIPIRTARGKKVRQAFIPRNESHVLMAADYSQIELRLMAAMSGDENMIQAFIEGKDIHRATAARVYGIPIETVDSDMRRKAKTVNFGIIYGITAFGLSQRIGISRSEASSIIKAYFTQYPKVKAYMTSIVEKAKEQGYVETLLGRRRYLKDINSGNRTIRQFAERNAINSPLQGSAADIIKRAMIDIHREIEQRQLRSKMILQVHDELVFDVYKPELEEMRALVVDKMENAIQLIVPLKVEVGIGNNWLEAH